MPGKRTPTLVQDFLQHSTEHLPDKVALVFGDRRLTYAELDAMADRLAQALRTQGVRRGDRVAIYLQNSVETVVGIFAALKAGGVFVVINHTTKHDKLVYILNNCRARVLLIESRRADMLTEILPACPSIAYAVTCGGQADEGEIPATDTAAGVVVEPFAAIQANYPAERLPTENIDLDLACLIYTSGSTGDPKGVMSDHSNVVFATGSIIQYLENTEDDIVIVVLPLSFDYGLYQLLMTLRFGGTLVLERGFAYPAAILGKMAKERVTGFPGVPTVFALLVRMDLSAYDLSSLRYLTNTAAALPPSHIMPVSYTHLTLPTILLV